MPRSARAYLEDIRDACAAIEHITTASVLAAYLADRVQRSAVEREFLIIGEAVNRLSILWPDIATALTGARLIVDFRNRLAHEYHNIDDEMVWAIAEVEVPVLAREIDGALAGLAEE